MKTMVFITAIFTLTFFVGCSTTTYFNLKATYPEYIEKELYKAERDEGVGVEVSLLLNNGNEFNGELMSIRDSTMTLCTEYSATEEELTKLTYPISLISNNEIKELTIEGSNYIWTGLGIGAAVCVLAVGLSKEGVAELEYEAAMVAVVVIGALPFAGAIVGYALSTDDVILQEIPPDYNWSILKPLARYPDEEPEYLRAIE